MIKGIDALCFGVTDREQCARFLHDWGLQQASDECFTTVDGGEVWLADHNDADLPPAFESGATLRHVIWGVSDENALASLATSIRTHPRFTEYRSMPTLVDPDGMTISFRVSSRTHVAPEGVAMNTGNNPVARVDQRAPVYDCAQPLRIGHMVLFSADVMASVEFYTTVLGFQISDYYPNAGYFLRCERVGPHHQLFLLQHPQGNAGLNHVAFTVRDIHEVFGGGLHIARQGWDTQLGPGRHPISSAYFWYVKSPSGGLFEYFADEDWCTADWPAKAWERTPEHFAEWAIAGGIDGHSRRQHSE